MGSILPEVIVRKPNCDGPMWNVSPGDEDVGVSRNGWVVEKLAKLRTRPPARAGSTK
jgi:hypothetical protein